MTQKRSGRSTTVLDTEAKGHFVRQQKHRQTQRTAARLAKEIDESRCADFPTHPVHVRALVCACDAVVCRLMFRKYVGCEILNEHSCGRTRSRSTKWPIETIETLADVQLYTTTTIQTYDTIRDAVLTCARKPTRVSFIYRTETTTKNIVKQKN